MSTFNRPNLPTEPRRPWVAPTLKLVEQLRMCCRVAAAKTASWVVILESIASKPPWRGMKPDVVPDHLRRRCAYGRSAD
jgi:hypothetical protein